MAVTTVSFPQRKSFSRIPMIRSMPNLIQVQLDSFEWFKTEGLRELFAEISPIEDFTNKNLRLDFIVPDEPFGQPKFSEEESRARDASYSAPLYIDARLTNKETGSIVEKSIFMGDFPLMTRDGTFVINGAERVVVSQLVRSPGVYFTAEEDVNSGAKLFAAKLIPNRGAWLEFETSNRHILYVKIDRKRKLPVTTLLRAMAAISDRDLGRTPSTPLLTTNETMLEVFKDVDTGPVSYIAATLAKDTFTPDESLIEVYKKLRPGDPATPDNARNLVTNLFYQPRRYDLGNVGRYKLNRKLSLGISQTIHTLTQDDMIAIVKRLIMLNNTQGHPDDIDHLGNRRIRSVGELIQSQLRVGLLRMERVVKERISVEQDPAQVTPGKLINIRPIVAAMKEFFGGSQLSQFMDQINPLAEIGHKRRLSALGPGGLSRDRAGFEVRDVHSSHYGRICPIETPEGPNIGLIGNMATFALINRFGFIETPYRRVFHEMDSNDSQLLNRIARKDITIHNSVILQAGQTVDDSVFATLQSLPEPVSVPIQSWVSNIVEYLTADEEEDYVIAQANAPLDSHNHLLGERVTCRYHGEFTEEGSQYVNYMDVSPSQMVSVPAALIPFLEHDDVNRALMGANMQRQAVPLLRPQTPIVGTGIEGQVARDSGHVVVSRVTGEVVSSVSDEIVVLDEHGEPHSHKLRKFIRSNQGTCINQRPIVHKGDLIQKGDPIADSSSTENGELALGQNILVAFMTWEGGNFEDAILISERIVREDYFTSIHIEKHEIEARDTKLGPEEITRDIPNIGEDGLRNLDEDGIVYIGAQVEPGDILVGKITPKGETELTAEEKLIRAIFGEKAKEVKDTSLRVPHGEHGKVVEIKRFTRDSGDELLPGVHQVVRVSIAQKRKIGAGDKMAGRHGNKGVISRVLPIEDMPYLPDGTPVDIILNPLGIPHRMNIGQVMETHLGWAAEKLGIRVATPVFDGASEEDIADMLEKAGLPREGKVDLYDGRTGEKFESRVTVGYKYMLKLAHLVEDKVHARSTGPYSLITQQPLGGKAQFGGQRFGEMEVWALEAYGAANILQEILTVKSDDVTGRVKTYEAIVKGEPIMEPGVPESFKVLVNELKSLGINVEILNEDEEKIPFSEDLSNDIMPELGINLSGFEGEG